MFGNSFRSRLMGAVGAVMVVLVPGMSLALELGNLVFADSNGNGVADPGEGVADVQVQLFAFGADPLNSLPLQSRFTGSDGNYQFNDVAPGFYFVFIPPSEFLLSQPLHRMLSVPGDGFEQDDNFSEDGFDDAEPYLHGIRTDDLFLQSGQLPTGATYETGFRNEDDNNADADGDLTIDFGFFRPVSIGNLVFLDVNGNGSADAGEGLAGVPVELFAGGDDPATAAPVQTTVTAEDGTYLFTELPAGDYKLRLPPEVFGPGGVLRGMVSMAGTGEEGTDDDLGEDGLDSIDVEALGLLTAVFSLAPGTAPTGESGETGWASDADDLVDDDTDLTRDFGLMAGPDRFGIGNLVFEDFNGNGVADEGEGVDGVVVQLYGAGMNPTEDPPLEQVITDNGGRYRFGGLVAGTYFVHLPAPLFGPFAVLSRATPMAVEAVEGDDDAGQDGRSSGEPDRVGVSSGLVTLSAGSQPVDSGTETGVDRASDGPLDADVDLTIDFGFVREVGLGFGNVVFYDSNTNGVMDSGEGVSGVPVQLFREGDDPLTDAPLDSLLSQGDGQYLFSNLRAGRYFAHVPAVAFAVGQPLEGAGVITDAGLDDGTDDDADQNLLNVSSPGLEGVVTRVVELSAGDEPTAATGETGFGAESDDFDDANFDLTIDLGFRSPCSTFLMGPQLIGPASQGSPFSVTFTSLGGVGPYLFSAVGSLPAGLMLSEAGELQGTPLVQGVFPVRVRAVDSGGCTGVLEVALAIAPAAVQLGVGNLVFVDGNANGVADAGEGKAGVTVQLFAEGQDPLAASPMLTTLTDGNGFFRFQGLLPGFYFLHVPSTEFAEAKVLHRHLSVPGAGSDDGLDDDVGENGVDAVNPMLTGISTGVFELAAGAEPNGASESGLGGNDDAANDSHEDLTMDFGFVSACETLVLGPLALPRGWTSLAYDESVEVVGGLAPYTFTATSGLPSGVTLDAAGQLSGTPALAGTYTIEVEVVDARGCTGGGSVTLVIDVPPTKGKIGNVIFADANLNGRHDEGEGVGGVTVELMNFSAPRTVLYDSMETDAQGRFLFENVDPGTYHLRVSSAMFGPGAPLEGMESMPGVTEGDDDVGEEGQDATEPAITGVVTAFFTLSMGAAPTASDGETGFESETDDDVDEFVDLTRDLGFGRVLPPASFSEWQLKHSLEGQNGPLLNPDGDLHSNLIEYALLKSPDSGLEFQETRGFRLEATGTGVLASYSRRAGGGGMDLSYTLEGETAGGWVPLGGVPMVVAVDTSVERVVFDNIEMDPAFGGASLGRVRLRVGLDTNADDVPDEEDVTEAWTWSRQSMSVGVPRTFTMPLMRTEIFRGTAGSMNGSLVDLAGSLNAADNVGFSMQQAQAGSFYLEILSGPDAGHRLEVNEAGSTVTAVAVDFSSARSTPAGAFSLDGELVCIRRHWTLDSVLPKEALRATTSSATADHMLFFSTDTNGFEDHWLLNFAGERRWVKSGDATVSPQGNRVFGVAEGAFFTPRSASSAPYVVGVERSGPMVVRLAVGNNFVGAPFLEEASPMSLQMTTESGFTGNNSSTTADRLRVWLGESSGAGYGSYFYLKAGPFDQWAISGDASVADYSSVLLFQPFRAAFVVSVTSHSNWKITPPVPGL